MRKALVAAVIFFVCAELAFASIGRSGLVGLPSQAIAVIAIAVVLITFIALAATEARGAGSKWVVSGLKVTVLAAASAALAHAVLYSLQVDFGRACNQCQPLAVLFVYPAVAALIAAASALLVGFIARRV